MTKEIPLGFGELHRRLVGYLHELVHNGNMTERRLARITSISQPHIHQVLKGTKSFSLESADRVLQALHNDLLDFLDPKDIEEWKSRDTFVVE